jgi:purine-cytosine permease-like protein
MDAQRSQIGSGTYRATTVEAHSIDYVPERERHGSSLEQTGFWFVGNFVFLTAAIGFIGPSMGLSLGWSILAAGAGNFLGAVFMALHATQGPRLGLPQLVQARAQMGYTGVIAALVATATTFVLLNVLNTMVTSSGLNAIYGWNGTAVAIIAAVVGVVTAVYGHDLLHRTFTVLLLVSMPLFLLLGLGIVTGSAGGHAVAQGSFSMSAFMVSFAAAASYNIAFAPFVSDFTRYMPKDTPAWKTIVAVFGGAGLSGFIMIALGSWLAASLGAADALSGMKTAGDNMFGGFGTVVIIVAVVTQVVTLGMTAYSAHLTIITAVDSFKTIRPSRGGRAAVIVGLAIAWTVIAIGLPSSYVSALNNILVVMLYLLVPWSGLNLVDFFLVRRSHYAILDLFTPTGIYGRWSWPGLLAYGVGFVAMIPFAVFTGWQGPVAVSLSGADISWLVGFIVSGVVYYVATAIRGIDRVGEATAIRASEEALSLADVQAARAGSPRPEMPIDPLPGRA